MKVYLKSISNNKIIRAKISKAIESDMPIKKEGWRFSWHKLSKTKGADFYKLTRVDTPQITEGILMLSLLNEEMLYMNNLEIAPQNYGSKGKYENVAGCLIAFACYKSFELGTNHYLGYVSFDSKKELIRLYQDKYGATHAVGQKMFIDPKNGKQLIEKYLNINI